MPGTLYGRAPIGNLEDVTLRALRILREASVIAAEDTRRTARLLQHYSISTPTTSLHAHNEDSKPRLIERLRAGESVRWCPMRERPWSRIPERRSSPRPTRRVSVLSQCRELMRPLPQFPRQVSAAASSCSSFPRLERAPGSSG